MPSFKIRNINLFYDILLTQEESMSLFSQGKLDIDIFFTVWMALNFDKFPAGMLNENIQVTWQTYGGESSGFQNAISFCMDVYANETDEPVIHDDATAYKTNHRNAVVIILVKELWENEVKT